MNSINTMDEQKTYTIPSPPVEAFEVQVDRAKDIVRENKIVLNLREVQYTSNGILLWFEDCPYPRKGFPFPAAGLATNLCKRVLVEALKLNLFFNPLSKLIRRYNAICYREMEPFVLKPSLMTPFASELKSFIQYLLARFKLPEEDIIQFASVISHIFEYDDAYRYRLQDLATECSKSALIKNPRKEIRRIAGIYSERELSGIVSDKFKRTVWLASMLLLIPRVNKSFIRAVSHSDFSNLRLDEADRFWVSHRGDYLFFGETYEARSARVPKLKGYKIVI